VFTDPGDGNGYKALQLNGTVFSGLTVGTSNLVPKIDFISEVTLTLKNDISGTGKALINLQVKGVQKSQSYLLNNDILLNNIAFNTIKDQFDSEFEAGILTENLIVKLSINKIYYRD
jgi:hypothetical protein